MRLSESLRKNVMETATGRILNKFKIKKRRNILFFEDILAAYIKECESAGYGKEMQAISQKWCAMITKQLTPEPLLKLPSSLFFGLVAEKVWINLGLLDDLGISKKNNFITIRTTNEAVTRIIGKNRFSIGSYMGILNAFFKCQVECIDVVQTKKNSTYMFKLKDAPFEIKTRDINLYNDSNSLAHDVGPTLKTMFVSNIFQLRENNRIYFRGKRIGLVEGTIFHLISNEKILLERVPIISYMYFNEVIKKKSSDVEKLMLLKSLFQVMGWGATKIVIKNADEILVFIRTPPHGMQLEKDNWEFLTKTILGYMRLLNKNFKITETVYSNNSLKISYSR